VSFTITCIAALFLIPQLGGEDYLADSHLYHFVCGGGENGLCTILVGRVLYEAPDVSPNFFVRFRLVNRSDAELWVDLRDYWALVRPIQYTSSDDEVLTVISIRTPVVPTVTEEYTADAIEALTTGLFTPLPAWSGLDVYVDFNAAGRDAIDALEEQYLFIGYGGWFTVTDGMSVQVLYPDEDFIHLRTRLPVLWDKVPPGSIIAYDHTLGVTVEEY